MHRSSPPRGGLARPVEPGSPHGARVTDGYALLGDLPRGRCLIARGPKWRRGAPRSPGPAGPCWPIPSPALSNFPTGDPSSEVVAIEHSGSVGGGPTPAARQSSRRIRTVRRSRGGRFRHAASDLLAPEGTWPRTSRSADPGQAIRCDRGLERSPTKDTPGSLGHDATFPTSSTCASSRTGRPSCTATTFPTRLMPAASHHFGFTRTSGRPMTSTSRARDAAWGSAASARARSAIERAVGVTGPKAGPAAGSQPACPSAGDAERRSERARAGILGSRGRVASLPMPLTRDPKVLSSGGHAGS